MYAYIRMLTKKRKSFNHRKSKKTKPETQLVCKPFVLDSFEAKFEKTFKTATNRETSNVERYLVNLLKHPFGSAKYTPHDDYYTYVNHTWIAAKKLEVERDKKFYVQNDSFRIVQEKVYYELIDLTKEYIKTNDTAKSRAIKNLYESMLHLDDKEAEDVVKYTTKKVDNAIANDTLYWLLAQINQNEILAWGCPISWAVSKDSKHSTLYKSDISAPKLTAYDYTYYIEDEKDNSHTKHNKRLYKTKYLEFIQNLFDACLGKGHGIKPIDIWNVEYDLLTMMGCDSVKNESKEYYNVVTKEDALNKYGFDWEMFAKEVGYKHVPSTFICSNLSYLKCVMETMTKDGTWKTPKWRAYFLYIIFRQIMRFHKKWRLIYWEFHGKFVQSEQTAWPDEIYPVFGLSLCFNTFLTNEYIKYVAYEQQEHIQYVTNMAADLLTVFKRIIKRNTWLSPETKKYALLKLEHIKLIVGNPMMLREDPLLSYNSRGAYQNIKKIAWWRTKKMISIDGTAYKGDLPIIDWEQFKLVGSQAYVVNAYYTPVENTIYVPLAYLQKPFINLREKGIEYNLAHIGYTLAHEMSHSLDDTGSKYDYHGNLHNWWTKEDRRKFDHKVKDIIKQYETFSAYDGIKKDETLSTGENIADISGLAICMEYLRDFRQYSDSIKPIIAVSFEMFFIFIAVQARQQIANSAINAQLKINPHPLDKYRVNCPLARLESFRSFYNIKPGDKMYWSSTDTIW